MIVRGKYTFDGVSYDSRLECSDWRYAAAALGMLRFFGRRKILHHREARYLYYNLSDVYSSDGKSDMAYLQFAESRFKGRMHHIVLEKCLCQSEFSEADIGEINKRLSANTVMKKVFKGIKVDADNILCMKEKIRGLIRENKEELIRQTFVNSVEGYRKFINTAKFRSPEDEICRLLGFYADTGRKTKSLGFGFDKEARTSNDAVEFDFLPFAFSGSNPSVFINNNTSLENLRQSNDEMDRFLEDKLEDKKMWNAAFYTYGEGSIFIDYDVEVIAKDTDKERYETVFVRKSAIEMFKAINREWRGRNSSTSLDLALKRFIKVSDDYYINVMEEVTDAILNERLLDELIERLMKMAYETQTETVDTFLLYHLVHINTIIYRYSGKTEGKMDLKASSAAAFTMVDYFKKNRQENKIKAYRQRLTGALVANDYDRFIEIMLQMSSYADIALPFMHTLLQDFEGNKNLAYDFVNRLIDGNRENKTKEE